MQKKLKMKLIKIIFIATTLYFCMSSELSADIVSNNKNKMSGVSSLFQNDTLPVGNTKESVMAIAKAYGDSIVLRIFPPDYTFWESGRRSGFVIKRGSNEGDLKVIATVFPLPKDKLDSKTDTALMAASKIMYEPMDKSKVQGMYKEYEANKSIYGISILMAEFSAPVATAFGLRYVDKDVQSGQTYYYEVSCPEYKAEKYKGYLSLKNEVLPERSPYDVKALVGDGTITLQWSKDYNKSHFSHYRIERSTDNKTFIPLSARPIVMMSDAESQKPFFDYVDKADIINGTKYYYRLYGGNSYGEYSPAAEVQGTARDLTPPPAPKLSDVQYNDTTHVFAIEWENSIEDLTADFAYYQVMSARNSKGPYTAISPKLDFTDFAYAYAIGSDITEDMTGRYFFQINCYDENGNMSHSENLTSFVPDYIDPLAPDTLMGYIDTASMAHIHWKKSASNDVRGYWLYWANDPGDEFSLVSKDILEDTTYTYYIPEKSLNKYIYFVVRAEDEGHNRSQTTNIAKVRKLDQVPPVRPAIRSIVLDTSALKINIMLSPSDDVHFYELYRRGVSKRDTLWHLQDTLWSDSIYLDRTAESGISYQYRLRAIDSVGNKSDYSPIKNAKMKISGDILTVNDFDISQASNSKNVSLSWTFNAPEKLKSKKYNFELFRSSGLDGVKYYKTITGDKVSFLDENSEPNVLFNYAVRVRFDDGTSGALSDVKSILIK